MKKNFNYFLFFLLSLCWHIAMAPLFIHYYHPNLSLFSSFTNEKNRLSQSPSLKKKIIPFVKYRKQFATTTYFKPYSKKPKNLVKSYSSSQVTPQSKFYSSKNFSKTNKMMTTRRGNELGPKLTQNMLAAENKKILQKEFNLSPELNKKLQEVFPENFSLNIEIITPDEIKLDQMNNLQLKFYAFRQRQAQSYLTAVISSLNDFIRHYPHFRSLNIDHTLLSAEVTFTSKGQIERIRFLNTSDIVPVQWFFQDILERIVLHNPPKELLINDKLQLIYQLLIN